MILAKKSAVVFRPYIMTTSDNFYARVIPYKRFAKMAIVLPLSFRPRVIIFCGVYRIYPGACIVSKRMIK